MSSQAVGTTVALGIFFVLLALLVAPKWKWLVVAVAGLVVALVALLSDVSGLGTAVAFGRVQILGAIFGGLIFLIAIIIFLRTRNATPPQ